MLQSVTELKTESGRKYMVQLCKHFAHKIETSYLENTGICKFSCGIAEMEADDATLKITANATDADQLAQTQSVMESHLVRFAFREELKPLDWKIVDKAA